MFQALMADTLIVYDITKDDATKVVTTMRVYLNRWEARLIKFGIDFDSQYVMHSYNPIESELTVRLVSRSSAEYRDYINSRSILDFNVVNLISADNVDDAEILLDKMIDIANAP